MLFIVICYVVVHMLYYSVFTCLYVVATTADRPECSKKSSLQQFTTLRTILVSPKWRIFRHRVGYSGGKWWFVSISPDHQSTLDFSFPEMKVGGLFSVYHKKSCGWTGLLAMSILPPPTADSIWEQQDFVGSSVSWAVQVSMSNSVITICIGYRCNDASNRVVKSQISGKERSR